LVFEFPNSSLLFIGCCFYQSLLTLPPSNLLPSRRAGPILKVLDPTLLLIDVILKLAVITALSPKSDGHSKQVPHKKSL
jgi:hypothetical protein